jgi:hypothetical protein
MRIWPTVHCESEQRIDVPSYRVNFWERPAPAFGWNLEAWVLSDATGIAEVVTWITKNSAGRRYELFVESEEPRDSPFEVPRTAHLVRLSGTNPNAA